MTPTAIVFDIQRNSLEDGPGIRTTVFLKGCGMRCQWCHNPESFEHQPQTVTLPNGKIRTYGQRMSVDEVFTIVLADRPFYVTSGGGLTVSGGEPFLQPDFLVGLLQACKTAGIHTAVETNGFPPWHNYAPALPFLDLILFDYKATPSARHAELTGVSSEPVLERLDALIGAGKEVILRCPIVPTVNATDEHLAAIASLSHHYNLPVQIMPYHNTARDKWRALHLPNRLADLPAMTDEDTAQVMERLIVHGCQRDRLSLA